MRPALRPPLRQPWRSPWPGRCEVCRCWTADRLCGDCRRPLTTAVPRCLRCGLRVPAGLSECTDCRREPPPFARCVCATDYGFPWDRLIGRFKYEPAPELASLLSTALATAAGQTAAALPQAFVALPLSAARLRERGFDQAWELARRLGASLGLPAHARALERRFDGRAQAELTRTQRLRNLQGAFTVTASARPAVEGRHLALVDDVMTTGATAQEAARALLAAGAAQVDVWVVARTPAPAAHD